MADVQSTPARRNIKRQCMAEANNPNYRGGFAASCARCGAAVWVKPSRARRPNHFCSKACCNLWMKDNTTGPDHWRFQGGDVERTCEACGGRFFQRRAEFNRRPGKYCSKECSNRGRRRRRPAACEVCWAEFDAKAHRRNARFCSRACKRVSQTKVRSPEDIVRRRLHVRMSSLMYQTLRRKKAGRTWVSLVGYDAAALMRHLESQFLAGMSWDNMGDWHIDHVRPKSSFNFTSTDDPEFKACWALSNLRPLWEFDNLSKGAKWSPDDL